VLFYVSLGLNILVIGVVVGALAFGGRPAQRATIDSPVPFVRALTSEQRSALWQELRADPALQDRERPLQRLRRGRDMMRLLRAERFDAEAFSELLEVQTAVTSARAASGRAALVSMLSTMTQEDRIAYADRLEAALRAALRERRAPPPHRASGG
jgi:uncharacterized membrane protein